MSARPVRLILVLLGVVVAFIGLRLVHALQPEPTESAIFTGRVVVVGVTGRYQLNASDEAVISSSPEDVQVAAVSVRPRYVGDCAAAGWTTLGAGRRAAVGALCTPQVNAGAVTDWAERRTAAAARNGDAQLGTLASFSSACVAAVGPGAALAAAEPDGTIGKYTEADAFAASGYSLECPLTFIDAGDASDAVITELAKRDDLTLIVTGVGPAAGSDDPGVQVIYRLGTTIPGWLTSQSTRREGVVTLNDLTRTLVAFLQQTNDSAGEVKVDGAPFMVWPAQVTPQAAQQQLRSMAALSDATPIANIAMGIGGTIFFLGMIAALVLRRYSLARLVGALAVVLTAAMMLTGTVRWQDATSPALFLSLLLGVLAFALTALSLLISRSARVPVAVTAAAITAAAFTADAALGGVIQPGSMLNSRPIFGLRWYGFGNVTFAAYAAAGLVLAGYLAARLQAAGKRRLAVLALLGVGFTVIICEGWPSMGTDFGGVIALTPGVLWLALQVSGIKVTWPKLIGIGAAAVAAIALISVLDWRRPPVNRSHLGNFVQRIVDGDAVGVVVRKAIASWQTIASPLGIGAILVGVALWLVIFHYLLPRIDFHYLRAVALASLVTAILGTLLNDGGTSVWITLTGAFATSCLSLWLDQVAQVRSVALPVLASR